MEFARLALARVRGLCASSRDPYAASRIARLEHRFLNRVARLQHRMALSGRGPPFRCWKRAAAAPVLGKRNAWRDRLSQTSLLKEEIGWKLQPQKQQTSAGNPMATAQQAYLRTELHRRHERLESALRSPSADASLSPLLREVDAALARMDAGTYGLCNTCHEPIEAERLLADPLLQFCLDDLTSEERRALESDLSLAARIQQAYSRRAIFLRRDGKFATTTRRPAW